MKRNAYTKPETTVVPQPDERLMKVGTTETDDIFAKETDLGDDDPWVSDGIIDYEEVWLSAGD